MKKYLKIFELTSLQYFTYRLNFILWRVRNVFSLILVFFLWRNIYTNRSMMFSYTKEKLITYILAVNVFGALIFSTLATEIAGDILNGNIINQLLKPISFFKVVIAKEAADKLLNFSCSILEIVCLILIFQPKIFIQNNLFSYIATFIALTIGFASSFFISLTLSYIAFWTPEVWAPRFLYTILTTFMAGTFFPLDILPKPIYYLLLLTPFPYLIFLPAKVYIEGFSSSLLPLFLVGFTWSCLLFVFNKLIWQRGIKEFSFFGR